MNILEYFDYFYIKKYDIADFLVLRGGTSSDEEADESHLNVSSGFIIEFFKEKFKLNYVFLQRLLSFNILVLYWIPSDKKIEKSNHGNDVSY